MLGAGPAGGDLSIHCCALVTTTCMIAVFSSAMMYRVVSLLLDQLQLIIPYKEIISFIAHPVFEALDYTRF